MNKELIHEAKSTLINKVKENKKAAISIGAVVAAAFATLFCVVANEKPIFPESPEMVSFQTKLEQQNLIDDLVKCNSVLAGAYEAPQSFLLKCNDFAISAYDMQMKWKVSPRLIEERVAVEKNLNRFVERN